MMHTLGLYWRTVRHLTLRQIMYQVLHRLRGPARLRLPAAPPKGHFLTEPVADKPVSWTGETVTFLNQSVSLSDQINWNYAANGKLWTYNLNYFDVLNQPGLTPEAGLRLIHDFISQTRTLKDGLESYPTSLRLVNWVQFLSRHQIRDTTINAHLFAQTALLRRRLEYHLAGNHLLENGFALLTGALYFQHRNWFKTATDLVRSELNRQILADGGHDERSPMYHRILLDRLLDVSAALRTDTWHNDPALVRSLDVKAAQMQNWLTAVTFANDDVPMVNDAFLPVACWSGTPVATSGRGIVGGTQLHPDMAAGMPDQQPNGTAEKPYHSLTVSGYRTFRREHFELFVDVGPVGPDHQPGHAHADTFSFILYVNGLPIIVDTGTSTYEPGPRRAWERSTAAHNTVEVEGQNSSEVWAGFRVGRRARVTIREDTEIRLTAQHDGYRPWGVTHERSWSVEPTKLRIHDRLMRYGKAMKANSSGIARFYFHPTLPITGSEQGVTAGPVTLSFVSRARPDLRVVPGELADRFNRLRPSQCLEVRFVNELETLILPTA